MSEMDIGQIMERLPHRYPMLLVDKVVECDGKTRIVAIKNVTANEPFFRGHFPGRPVMPGVLQIEAMAQAGGILLMDLLGGSGAVPFFMAIDKAKFRKVVQPGDQLRIEIEILKLRAKLARFQGKITVDGEVVSEAELMCMVGGS